MPTKYEYEYVREDRRKVQLANLHGGYGGFAYVQYGDTRYQVIHISATWRASCQHLADAE